MANINRTILFPVIMQEYYHVESEAVKADKLRLVAVIPISNYLKLA